jgi:hypothetical protein
MVAAAAPQKRRRLRRRIFLLLVYLLSTPVELVPNNGLSGLFSWIKAYSPNFS